MRVRVIINFFSRIVFRCGAAAVLGRIGGGLKGFDALLTPRLA